MAKRIFVWADANCNGENIEWIELTGKQFFEFKKNPVNRNRYIIRLTDHYNYEDDVIYIEATEEKYKEWRKEYLHSLYIRKGRGNTVVVSFEELYENPGFDIDSGIDVEKEIVGDSAYDCLFEAIDKLSEKEKAFLQIEIDSIENNRLLLDLLPKYSVAKSTYFRNIKKIHKKLSIK